MVMLMRAWLVSCNLVAKTKEEQHCFYFVFLYFSACTVDSSRKVVIQDTRFLALTGDRLSRKDFVCIAGRQTDANMSNKI